MLQQSSHLCVPPSPSLPHPLPPLACSYLFLLFRFTSLWACAPLRSLHLFSSRYGWFLPSFLALYACIFFFFSNPLVCVLGYRTLCSTTSVRRSDPYLLRCYELCCLKPSPMPISGHSWRIVGLRGNRTRSNSRGGGCLSAGGERGLCMR
jgi:hypothetical protein